MGMFETSYIFKTPAQDLVKKLSVGERIKTMFARPPEMNGHLQNPPRARILYQISIYWALLRFL